ncbi:MAG: ATP-binding protein [Acidobacteriota bacterium]|jgi:signal transduction histidine kinase
MPLLRSRFSDRTAGDRRILQDFVRSLSVIVDPAQLHAVIAAQLREVFGLDRVALAVRDEDAGGYRLVARREAGDEAVDAPEMGWSEEAKLVRWLRVNEEPLVLSENPGVVEYVGAEEAARLSDAGFRGVVPLVAMNRLTGFLLLGSRDGSRASPSSSPDPAERDLLEQLAAQAALACENAALLEAQRARLRHLYRAERLATAGELAAGAAHEIRNPLTAIRSTIQYLHDTLSEDHPGRPEAAGLLEEVDRIDEIVEGLLSFARPREAVFAPLDAAEVVRQSVALVASRCRKQGVEVDAALDQAMPMIGDEGLLKQLFLNLLLNALQAMPEGGRLTVTGRPIPPGRSEPPERGGAFFEVSDTGPGVPEEIREKVFDPFFTTKAGGTGLGLSICYGIAERHRGEVEIADGAGGGAAVRVRLRGGSP